MRDQIETKMDQMKRYGSDETKLFKASRTKKRRRKRKGNSMLLVTSGFLLGFFRRFSVGAVLFVQTQPAAPID